MAYSESEHLGFIIRQIDAKTFSIVRGEKQYHCCESEKQAKKWIFRFRRMLNRTNSLKQTADDIVAFVPSDQEQEETNNIVAISNAPVADSTEKYIKITMKTNGSPHVECKNINANETLGLMRRADYMITNNVLRHGSV